MGPLRPGESAQYLRFFMDRDAYQTVSAPAFTRLFALGTHLLATAPGLRYSFTAHADPGAVAQVLGGIGALRAPDFQVGGRPFGAFVGDNRVLNGLALLALMLASSDGGAPRPPLRPVPTRLHRAACARAVRAALTDLPDDRALAANPLSDSRLTWLRAGVEAEHPARAAALRALVVEAIAGLEASPAGARTGPVMRRTYLEPAPVQKQAAGALGLTWGSYRRHLGDGVAQVVEQLWQREID
jgi:hypothetical protein